MSVATVHSDSCYELLVAFLMDYDRRVDEGQACALVRTHKCKFCRTSFSELLRKSQSLIFVKDSRGVVHELCQECADEILINDVGAKEINLSMLEDDVRKTIFGIMVGELRHTKFAGEPPKTPVASSTRQSDEEPNGALERKPVFVRNHPARRGMARLSV
jgi:hypothetical protein